MWMNFAFAMIGRCAKEEGLASRLELKGSNLRVGHILT